MIPLRNIGVKSARVTKKKNQGENPNSSFKRNVPSILDALSKNIDKVGINLNDHVLKVLSESPIGETTSLYQQLDYNRSVDTAMKLRQEQLVDHQYCSSEDADHRGDQPEEISAY